MILTDEEIEDLYFAELDNRELSFIRSVEAAVLEKLKQQEPVAFEYEIGTSVFSTGEYTNWIHQVTSLEPNTPLNAIRNLRPLYAAPMPDDVVKDAERLDFIEQCAAASRTGVSFDYVRHVEDGYVTERGFRMTEFHKLRSRHKNIREAIDAAIEETK